MKARSKREVLARCVRPAIGSVEFSIAIRVRLGDDALVHLDPDVAVGIGGQSHRGACEIRRAIDGLAAADRQRKYVFRSEDGRSGAGEDEFFTAGGPGEAACGVGNFGKAARSSGTASIYERMHVVMPGLWPHG